MPFIGVGDIQVYYEQGGSGPRLLFISGTGGDLRRRPSVFERPIAQHFEILTYDQRGLGQSSKPDRAYTMAEYAEDAIGLLDAIGWDRCHVIGVSFGGMVAQEIAIRQPKRVDRVVLACTSSGGAGNSECPSFYLDWSEWKDGHFDPPTRLRVRAGRGQGPAPRGAVARSSSARRIARSLRGENA